MVHFILGVVNSKPEKAELLWYSRVALWGMFPSWIMFINVDNLRNFFMANDSLNPPLIIEIIGTIISIVCCWIFTYILEWG